MACFTASVPTDANYYIHCGGGGTNAHTWKTAIINVWSSLSISKLYFFTKYGWRRLGGIGRVGASARGAKELGTIRTTTSEKNVTHSAYATSTWFGGCFSAIRPQEASTRFRADNLCNYRYNETKLATQHLTVCVCTCIHTYVHEDAHMLLYVVQLYTI